jgi:ABC-type phosphate/phosphonate transport system permease subunit
MYMDDILAYLLGIVVCFVIGFLVASGIVEAWVLFWNYGWIWNEYTVPPMVLWDIFFTNIITILIIAGVITVIAFILLYMYTDGY